MSEYDPQKRPPQTSLSTESRRRNVGRRNVLKATTGVAAGLSLAGCLEAYGTVAGSSDEEESVTIGVLAPDPESDFIGRSIVRAAEVAVDELNENGGINGKDVNLAVGDMNGSPLEARRQYQRLILEKEADVTVGVFASEALMNLMPEIAEQETVHLTSGAATTAASQLVFQDYDRFKYHFRVGPNNDFDLGRMQIEFLDDMSDEIGWDSIALLAEDYEWTSTPWEVYQDQIDTTGVDVVMDERYPPATDNFASLYDEAEEEGADAVFITTAHTGTAALLNWVSPSPRSFGFGGIHVPMQLPAYYEMVGGACQYGITQSSATATSSITDKTQDFVAAYQNEYAGSNPVYTGYHTYDAVKLFAEVVENEETVDSDVLVDALEEITYTGAAGTAEFHGPDHEFAHDLIYRQEDTIYLQWQENDDEEGVQEVIWPEVNKTADYITPPWLQ